MSFAYLPLYTGDYQRDTLHLSMLEHGAYLKLLMYCWDQQGPAPDDDRKLAGICNARSKEEVTAVRAILEEFFVLMGDGWYNKRLAQELDKARATSEMAHTRGRMSAEARRQKYGTAQPGKPFESLSKASQKASESLPNPPSPSPSPTPTPTKDKTHTRFSALAYLCDRGVDKQIANDWLAIRKAKKKPATETALKAIERQAEKAECAFSEVIRKCTEKGWSGFEADWMRTELTAQPKRQDAGPPWWSTNAGIEAKGAELGMRPRGGESWHDFKARINAALEAK